MDDTLKIQEYTLQLLEENNVSFSSFEEFRKFIIQKINDWIKVQPGFRFRSLSETDDGEWIDMVYWESLEAAKASGAKFGEEMGPTCEPLVEIGSVMVSHSKAHVMQKG